MRLRRLVQGHRSRVAVVIGLVLIVTMFGPSAASAAEDIAAGGKFRTGDSVEVATGETFDGNLYAFAGTIDIDGTLDGDLVASGGTISIDGTVTGDVTVAGGQLTVSGEVEGDVRFAGGQLTIDGPVGGDIAVVGGNADVNADVGSDVLFGTGQMNIGGDVAGQVYGAAGDYERTGSVAGLEDVTVGDDEAAPSFGDRLASGVRRFVALFLVGALVLTVARRPLDAVLARARNRPAASLLTGLIALAILALLLVLSIIVGIIWSIVFGLLQLGLLVGTYWFAFAAFWVVTAFALFLLTVYAAPIVTGLTGARLALPGNDSIWMQFAALAIGLVVFLVVTAIPFIGWIIGALALLFATGAIVLAFRNFGARAPEPVAAADAS